MKLNSDTTIEDSMLHYTYPQIVVEEVPGEISLALSISGCPLRCSGCHSAFTYNALAGIPLTSSELDNLILKHKHISCVLFYGGEWDVEALVPLLQQVKASNLAACLYTGFELIDIPDTLLNILDYIKVGPYIEDLGGLASKSTNQHLYKLTNGVVLTELFFNKDFN